MNTRFGRGSPQIMKLIKLFTLRLSCTDSSVAKAISAVILEKYTWGSLGPVPPMWAVYASDDQGVYSETERTIQNVMFRGRKWYWPFKKPLHNTASLCSYCVSYQGREWRKHNLQTQGKILYYKMSFCRLHHDSYFQFGGVLHEADFNVGFAAPTNPVESILFVFFPEFDPKH